MERRRRFDREKEEEEEEGKGMAGGEGAVKGIGGARVLWVEGLEEEVVKSAKG